MSLAVNAWRAASVRCCAATACAFHMQHLCSVRSQLAECKAPWVILALLVCTTTVSKLGASQTLAFIRSVCRTGQRSTPLHSSVLGRYVNCSILGAVGNCTSRVWSQEAETSVGRECVSGCPSSAPEPAAQRSQGHLFLPARSSVGPAC